MKQITFDKLSLQLDHDGSFFFKNISFQLEKGFLHSLRGRNGSGKSLLLTTLVNKKFSSGSIVGVNKMALVNQRYEQMIAHEFSFEKNLSFSAMGKFPSLFRKPRLESILYQDLIDSFKIPTSIPAKNLSGGQRQILALLMILQTECDFLLLDEPTAALDDENAILVFEFLQKMTLKGITLLVVCHDLELIQKYTTGRKLHIAVDQEGTRNVLEVEEGSG